MRFPQARADELVVVGGPPVRTATGRLVPGMFQSWMWVAAADPPQHHAPQRAVRLRRSLLDTVAMLSKAPAADSDGATPAVNEAVSSNVRRWRGPWSVCGQELRRLARQPCTGRVAGYLYNRATTLWTPEGDALVQGAVPRMHHMWVALVKCARTYRELAFLLRQWDGCLRWQDIKQKRAARAGPSSVEVVEKKACCGLVLIMWASQQNKMAYVTSNPPFTRRRKMTGASGIW